MIYAPKFDQVDWWSVDTRGGGHWALYLCQIKWKGSNFTPCCIDIHAPLILDIGIFFFLQNALEFGLRPDIGTEYCYFDDKFLQEIYTSMGGQQDSVGDVSNFLPEKIELVVKKSLDPEHQQTTSFILPSSILSRPGRNTWPFESQTLAPRAKTDQDQSRDVYFLGRVSAILLYLLTAT